MNKNDTILQVNNLSVAFGGRQVVKEVNYTLKRGCTLGIVGESGSGKSVSSLALMGLLPKQASVSGHAWLSPSVPGDSVAGASAPAGIAGSPLDLLSLDEAGFRAIRGHRIGMIFQEPMTSLNPVQRCGAQVLEMMNAHPNTQNTQINQKEKVLSLFREVLLPRPEKIFDSYPHEISGGQKQRVMIAMALAGEPDILIADEPTTALDVTVQKTILDLLRDLQRQRGISIIFITHDLGVIGQIADDILVMYRGQVVEQGPAADLLHHPQQPYTQGLLACRPPLDTRPKRLPTVEDYMNSKEQIETLETIEPIESIKSIESINSINSITPSLLSIRDLTVEYPLKRSLLGRPLQTLKGVDSVSFDIREGETLGLVGESGCGKTTLGRALLRLIGHSAGNISYRGRALDSLSPAEMRALRPKLQIIFQDPYSSLNPRITIGEAIAEPLKVHHRKPENPENPENPKERTLSLMQQVGLDPDWYHRYPHELSGGQRQRVCIARALILQPELVICDESVSALDVSVQAQVLNLLNDLKERYHYTYLFITHDLSVVHYMADRIMVMQKGKIVESGTPDDIFLRPQTDYTKTLIEAIPRLS